MTKFKFEKVHFEVREEFMSYNSAIFPSWIEFTHLVLYRVPARQTLDLPCLEIPKNRCYQLCSGVETTMTEMIYDDTNNGI